MSTSTLTYTERRALEPVLADPTAAVLALCDSSQSSGEAHWREGSHLIDGRSRLKADEPERALTAASASLQVTELASGADGFASVLNHGNVCRCTIGSFTNCKRRPGSRHPQAFVSCTTCAGRFLDLEWRHARPGCHRPSGAYSPDILFHRSSGRAFRCLQAVCRCSRTGPRNFGRLGSSASGPACEQTPGCAERVPRA